MTHLARSRGLPLDISIERWGPASFLVTNEDEKNFVRLLDVALSCSHRWHSLYIEDSTFLPLTLKKINGWVFPLLRRVSLQRQLCADTRLFNDLFDPEFLQPKYVPGLELIWISTPGFHRKYCFVHSKICRTLSLRGSSENLHVPSSLISFPALESLDFYLPNPRPFLEGIVVPNLKHLKYTQCGKCSYPVFSQPAKFKNVQHLVFDFISRFDSKLSLEEAITICTACPAVRHVELSTSLVPQIFGAGRLEDGSCLADQWMHLEHLTVMIFDKDGVPGVLVQWLKQRRFQGRLPLRVTFTQYRSSLLFWLPTLRESLLELQGVRLEINVRLGDKIDCLLVCTLCTNTMSTFTYLFTYKDPTLESRQLSIINEFQALGHIVQQGRTKFE